MSKAQEALSEIQRSGNPATSAEIAALRAKRPQFADLVETLEGKTLVEIEALLARSAVQAEMQNGRFWDVRRNGATKTWKTRPGHFMIPVKAGMRSHGYIRHDNLADFRVK